VNCWTTLNTFSSYLECKVFLRWGYFERYASSWRESKTSSSRWKALTSEGCCDGRGKGEEDGRRVTEGRKMVFRRAGVEAGGNTIWK
jgi:hypothetical protein